jgi:1-acyl-sn-glycerol-3-phosphate acyltransferase
VMNHAGMCFPWDFIGLLYLLSGVRDEPLRVVAHRSVFENRLVTWTFPPGWARTLGGVKATSEEFDVAFEHNPIVMIAPEGERGPNKGWHKRHRVMKFDPSFVKMSVKHSVPVLPIVCVGSESLTPLTYDLRALAEWCDLPFWAVSPWSLLSIPFPSMLM